MIDHLRCGSTLDEHDAAKFLVTRFRFVKLTQHRKSLQHLIRRESMQISENI